MHSKTELLTDRQMADFHIKVGDEITLDIPTGEGLFEHQLCQVVDMEIVEAGKHPESGEQLTRVTLFFD